jgi:hypothetical protein
VTGASAWHPGRVCIPCAVVALLLALFSPGRYAVKHYERLLRLDFPVVNALPFTVYLGAIDDIPGSATGLRSKRAQIVEGHKMAEDNTPMDEAIAKQRAKRAKEAKWLLAPPGSHESHVHIELTKGGPITPGIREAVEQLAIALGAVELSAQGIKECSPYKDCAVFKYSLCYAFASCKITNCKTFNSGGGGPPIIA